MSKHTPGPWFVEALTRDSGNPMVLAGADTIGAPGYDSGVASVVGRLSNIDANARLIAAAPELLEACEVALRELEKLNRGIGWRDGEWDSVLVLRAAIKKARGEK